MIPVIATAPDDIMWSAFMPRSNSETIWVYDMAALDYRYASALDRGTVLALDN